jgi:serine phosphatase RsbU (regulator of sigma subunit)
MKIGLKLTVLFVAIGLLSVSIIGYISYSEGKRSLEEESFNRLTAVREMKAAQIEDYFEMIENQIISYSQNYTVIDAMNSFKTGFDNAPQQYQEFHDSLTFEKSKIVGYYENEFLPRLNDNSKTKHTTEEFIIGNEAGSLLQSIFIADNPNPVGEKHHLTKIDDSLDYATTHMDYHPLFKDFLEKFGYYDIFLIDAESGNIVYSVFKEVDFGTSIKTGAFANSNLAKVYESAIGSNANDFVTLVDYEPYAASYNAPAAFMASPIFDKEVCIGVLVFQMPIEEINNIMTNREEWFEVGLGMSGETYLVSEDYTLRNQSRFLIEDRKEYFKMIEDIGMDKDVIHQIKTFNSCIGLQEVKTEGTIAALKGEKDTRIFEDYRGVEVLSSFKPLEISGLNWVIMSEIDKSEAFASVANLRNKILIFFGVTVVLVLFISYFASRMITKPIKSLTRTSRELARGNWDVEVKVNQSDEIGILALSFKSMQTSLKNLIADLKESNHTLEDKVSARTQELKHQKDLMEEKNREVLDSIHYAQRLQTAILPTSQFIYENIRESFVLFMPKDIVSGDFYWMKKVGDRILVAAVDCTGHGVPGAMVSIVGANGLNRCVNEFGLTKPSDILDKLRELVIETFDASHEEVKDGMDMSLLSVDIKNHKLEYAGANNPLWMAINETKQIEIIKADKQPIGKFDHAKPFTNHEVQLEKGDCVYIFTDGYADQFGGTKGKKLKYKPLQELILSNTHLPMHEQKTILHNSFIEWMSDFEQVDDVCIIGVKL